MKLLTVLPVLLLLAGCSSGWQATPPAGQRDLLVLEPLPPLSFPSAARGLQLNVLFHVMRDGTVSEVRFLGAGSGNAEWDSLARQSMQRWQFMRIPGDGPPIDTWVRQPVIVQVQQNAPMVMLLGQISVAGRREADSLYLLLTTGASFDALARGSFGAGDERSGYLGPVDIAGFPVPLKTTLQSLQPDKVTEPLQVGDRFVIYKRFTKESAAAVRE